MHRKDKMLIITYGQSEFFGSEQGFIRFLIEKFFPPKDPAGLVMLLLAILLILVPVYMIATANEKEPDGRTFSMSFYLLANMLYFTAVDVIPYFFYWLDGDIISIIPILVEAFCYFIAILFIIPLIVETVKMVGGLISGEEY